MSKVSPTLYLSIIYVKWKFHRVDPYHISCLCFLFQSLFRNSSTKLSTLSSCGNNNTNKTFKILFQNSISLLDLVWPPYSSKILLSLNLSALFGLKDDRQECELSTKKCHIIVYKEEIQEEVPVFNTTLWLPRSSQSICHWSLNLFQMRGVASGHFCSNKIRLQISRVLETWTLECPEWLRLKDKITRMRGDGAT